MRHRPRLHLQIRQPATNPSPDETPAPAPSPDETPAPAPSPDETPATDPSPDETPEAPTERNAENILAKISADSGGSVVGNSYMFYDFNGNGVQEAFALVDVGGRNGNLVQWRGFYFQCS